MGNLRDGVGGSETSATTPTPPVHDGKKTIRMVMAIISAVVVVGATLITGALWISTSHDSGTRSVFGDPAVRAPLSGNGGGSVASPAPAPQGDVQIVNGLILPTVSASDTREQSVRKSMEVYFRALDTQDLPYIAYFAQGAVGAGFQGSVMGLGRIPFADSGVDNVVMQPSTDGYFTADVTYHLGSHTGISQRFYFVALHPGLPWLVHGHHKI